MTDENNMEQVTKIAYQLQALVDAVKSLNEIQNCRNDSDESPTVYTVETTDENEMQRMLKSTEAILALNEIVNDSWQRSMIHHGGADQLMDADGKAICPSEAMSRYRDHIFEILLQHGISLDEML
jgi:hypothetical protein